MEATKRNIALVNNITCQLENAGCTVKDATEILAYASREIVANSKVQSSKISYQED